MDFYILFFLIYFKSFMEVYLAYNAGLISAVQQNGLVIYTHTYIYIFFIFFSIMVYYKILSIILCALQ